MDEKSLQSQMYVTTGVTIQPHRVFCNWLYFATCPKQLQGL
jgi:hypothetical protein